MLETPLKLGSVNSNEVIIVIIFIESHEEAAREKSCCRPRYRIDINIDMKTKEIITVGEKNGVLPENIVTVLECIDKFMVFQNNFI